MDQLEPAVNLLTAMITPAVVISACGTLIMSTTTRAARVNDRLHKWADDFVALMREESDDPLRAEHRAMVFHQIDQLTSRARILQLSLMAFYVSLALFVATSFAIGVFTAAASFGYSWRWDGWITVTFALLGGGGLLTGSTLLISEARRALASNNEEMDFIWQFGKRHANDELLEELRAGRPSFARLPRIPGMTGRNRKA